MFNYSRRSLFLFICLISSASSTDDEEQPQQHGQGSKAAAALLDSLTPTDLTSKKRKTKCPSCKIRADHHHFGKHHKDCPGPPLTSLTPTAMKPLGQDTVYPKQEQKSTEINLYPPESITGPAKEEQLVYIFDIVSKRLTDWKQFARVLDIEYIIKEIEENDKYNDDLEQKVKHCIIEKNSSSQKDWFYWKHILFEMSEKDLAEDLEHLLPNLGEENHQVTIGFCIFAHHADRAENFKLMPVRFKDQGVKICVGPGRIAKTYSNSSIINDYFHRYSVLERVRKYDFSNINSNKECQILKTQYEWLEKNNDQGFSVKGYDPSDHLKLFCEDYINTNPQKDSVLTYSTKYNVVLHITTAGNDIKKSMRDNCYKIRPFKTANQSLNDKSFIYVPVILLLHKSFYKVKCETCIDSGLVILSDTFTKLSLFEIWWENIWDEIKDIKLDLEQKTDEISNELLKSIIAFKAISSFNLPTFTNDPEMQIQEAQKLIMLTPEQQSIVYSKNKRKIIKGSFGSGKTVISKVIINSISNNLCDDEIIYYLLHDSSSAYMQEMVSLVKTLNSNKIIACRVADLCRYMQRLSSIFKYLLEINQNKIIHVFIEEFNGEDLDKDEVDEIQILLQSDEFKNSNIVIVAQSMESRRYVNQDKSDKYRYEELLERSDFEIFTLSYIIRSSDSINNLIDSALKILKKTVTESILPDFKSKTSSKAIKPIQKRTMTVQKSSINKEYLNIQPTTADDTVKTAFERIVTRPTSYNVLDTDKILKQFTLKHKQYESKISIKSRFKYIGERNKAHCVQGIMPKVYYPFTKDIKKYFDQIFCITEVLKDILKENKKQVLICLNAESVAILTDVLNIIEIKWTNDAEIYSKENYDVLLTDYVYIRGCEFLNVILIYPIDEYHLKHNIIDCISRCVFNLRVIVLMREIPDPDLREILDQWKRANLVEVCNYNYLVQDLNFFEKNYQHLKKEVPKQLFSEIDVKDFLPTILQKLPTIKRTQRDNTKKTIPPQLSIASNERDNNDNTKNAIPQQLSIASNERDNNVPNALSKEMYIIIFDTISQQISDWRRFGRLIGLEEHIIDNIEQDESQKKCEMLHMCLEMKKESAKDSLGWGFWKERLLKFSEGVKVVGALEKQFSSLSNSITNQDQAIPMWPTIFDEICKRIDNWRRFGRLLGLEDHVLNTINRDYAKKNERTYRCIRHKNDNKEVVGWNFWRDKLLKFEEGEEIVNVLEKQYPMLSESINKENNDKGTEDIFIDIFDKISRGIGNWERFARLLEIEENARIGLEYNRAYELTEEKIHRCIQVKKTRDWYYWRGILLAVDEKDLVENIEKIHPELLDDERITVTVD